VLRRTKLAVYTAGKTMVADKSDFGFAVELMRDLVCADEMGNQARTSVTALADQFHVDVACPA
jgi:hypothetical protein